MLHAYGTPLADHMSGIVVYPMKSRRFGGSLCGILGRHITQQEGIFSLRLYNMVAVYTSTV